MMKIYDEHYFYEFRNTDKRQFLNGGTGFPDRGSAMDTYAIVYITNNLVKTCEAPACELQLVPAPKFAALKLIRCVEENTENNGFHLNESKYPLFICLSEKKASKTLNSLVYCAEIYLRKEIKKQNGNMLFSYQRGDESKNTFCDLTAHLGDLLVRLKLLQLHYRIKLWYASRKSIYPKVLLQNSIVPMLPLIKYPRDNTVPEIRIPKAFQTSYVHNTSLAIDKILADPVFGLNSVYRQIVDRPNSCRKTGKRPTEDRLGVL